jgi:hypothetical protein
MTDDSKAGSSSRWVAWTAALVIFLPIFYFLSVGPATWLMTKTGGSKSPFFKMINVIYAPLGWLANHHHHFRDFLFAYLKLFGFG